MFLLCLSSWLVSFAPGRPNNCINPIQSADSVRPISGAHPFCNKYPETITSPGVPIGTIFPSESTTLAVTWGKTLPTVSTRLVIESAGVDWNDTGLVSASIVPSQKQTGVQKKKRWLAYSCRMRQSNLSNSVSRWVSSLDQWERVILQQFPS